MIGFREMSEVLAEAQPIEVDVIASRSKGHVLARAAMAPGRAVWMRNLNIPAPIAAMAAALIVVLFVGLVVSLQRSGSPIIVARSETQGTAFEEIVRYLDARQKQQPVVFRLPENARLRVVSEPTFVRAEEYQHSIK
jgi:anti-sigma-K factor RskA